ncbi:hypothetical protein HPB49_017091 [Dermacentor silvarum]|uniref:Uncharacterized protein n=1 Tax=Dermacentor silvarum TaxID=543639 RepID=A0ACB8CLR8_DERSI|nr:hypothetical protein HPB49_017091 [Dermacentor silvarum]
MIVVALLASLRGGTRTRIITACDSPACLAHSKAFEGVLNYSVDPCVDMDAFVCSKGAGYHTAGWRTPPSLVAHVIRQYELQIVELFLHGNTKFAASKIVTDFLLECTNTHKTPQGLDAFIDIFNLVPVPWPFEYSTTAELHPLEAVLTLSIMFGVDTWFRAYIGNSRQMTSGANSTPALFIEPSLWLSFLRTVGDRRELYFEELHRLYNATLPDDDEKADLLATEKGVLHILHNARTKGPPAGPAVATVVKIAAFVSNSTVSNWLEPVSIAPGGSTADETMLVSLEDVRVLRAVDALLSTYSVSALTQHLSWWLVQILTVIGWSQGFYVIAGSQAAAAAGTSVECYSIAASKFGLLMASESAVSLFAREARLEADSFFKNLTASLVHAVDKTPWLTTDTKAAILRRLRQLEVCVWPPDVGRSDEVLWQLYSDFCLSNCERGGGRTTAKLSMFSASTAATAAHPALIDYWLFTSTMLWRKTRDQYEEMQLRWQGDALEVVRYEPWNNRLRVSHAALRSAEMLPANFAGLGAAFLAHVLLMLMPPDPSIDDGIIPAPWTDIASLARRAEDLQCDPELFDNFADVAALGFAWHALKASTGQLRSGLTSSLTPETFLAIRDANGHEHMYTGDQLFFLTYCLSRYIKRIHLAQLRQHSI